MSRDDYVEVTFRLHSQNYEKLFSTRLTFGADEQIDGEPATNDLHSPLSHS